MDESAYDRDRRAAEVASVDDDRNDRVATLNARSSIMERLAAATRAQRGPVIQYADATDEIRRQIAARYGNAGDDVLDGLRFQQLVCPHLGGDRSGYALLAWPAGEIITTENVIVGYYGDVPQPTAADPA